MVFEEPKTPRRLPKTRTAILPGPAKVAVLMQRYRDGEYLWHPLDAKPDLGAKPPHRAPLGRRAAA